MKSSVYQCSIVELPKIHNRAGNITAIENQLHAPFDIKRVYYLYDVPGGEDRGGHGHRTLQQFIVAVSGAFDVKLDDGVNKKIIHLDRPYMGLHVIPGIWRELLNFSSGAICLVLASDIYEEADYMRNYNDFSDFKNEL
jgi:dTDP-4-dehydrorhamnose 3,5-epimerase-like enzyme